MSDRNKVTFIAQNYENKQTGETARGITVILDGSIKELVEHLHQDFPEYSGDDVRLIQEALFRGFNEMTAEAKERRDAKQEQEKTEE